MAGAWLLVAMLATVVLGDEGGNGAAPKSTLVLGKDTFEVGSAPRLKCK